MRTVTLRWYDMPGGFRQVTTGHVTLSQPDYRRLVRMTGDAVTYSQDKTVDGYAAVTVIPATRKVREYIAARGTTKRQRVQYFEHMAAREAYRTAIVEKVESTPSIAKRIFNV